MPLRSRRAEHCWSRGDLKRGGDALEGAGTLERGGDALEGAGPLEQGGDGARERAPSMEGLERLLGRSGPKSSRVRFWSAEVYE